jgi:initiation factor 1A
MVRNTTGGTGTKSLARKNQTSQSNRLQLPASNQELVTCVTKMLGSGMCYAETNDKHQLICHIRGKFSGKNKRNNMISVGSVVLVGLRDWEKEAKNCDLLAIYSSNQIEELRNNPNLDVDHVLASSLDGTTAFKKNKSQDNDGDIVFTEKKDEEFDSILLENQENDFTLQEEDEVEIDDI